MIGISWRNNRRHEFFLGLSVVALAVGIGFSNPAFFSLDNLFDLCRNSTVIGILALGVTFALVSGGIDVSFTAIAAFSFYATTRILLAGGIEGSLLLPFLISGTIGLLLGAVNACFVSLLRLPTLIVTLGTLSLFRGLLLTLVGSEYITQLPPDMVELSRLSLWEGSSGGAVYRLPALFLLLPLAAFASALILNRTVAGRGIQAMGGSIQAAERSGFNLQFLQFLVYGYVGLLAGIAGMTHAVLVRFANPFDLVGSELTVIAAVVLGGARITGGRGTIVGTLLGVATIVIINNNLILLGVPPSWQKVAVGLLILVGTGGPILLDRVRLKARGGRRDVA